MRTRSAVTLLATTSILIAGAGAAYAVTSAGAASRPSVPLAASPYPVGTGDANVTVGADGKLVYTPDKNGDVIPDFSKAGYGGGGVPIPSVPTAVTVPVGQGDASGRIQAAIDQLAARPAGADGFRGAVALRAGVYDLRSTINIKTSGIVLRGAGNGPNGTILRLGGDFVGPAIFVKGSSRNKEVPNTRHKMVDSYVPVGAKWFRLDSVAGLKVGDNLAVERPATVNWLADIGQPNWTTKRFKITWDRTITKIDGNTVTIDAPITQALESRYGGGFAYKRVVSNRFEKVGIEGLRTESTIGVDELGNFAGKFLDIEGLANGWVDRVSKVNMRGHAIKIHNSKALTIQNATSANHPLPGKHSGPSTQIFTMSFSQLLLWRNITSSDGGFEFSSGPLNQGPNVWLDSKVPHGFAATSPHMKWSVATLYDRLDLNQALSIQNNYGSHGWTAANSVVWNIKARKGINCDRPPTAHQWVFGAVSATPIKGPRPGGRPCESTSFGTHVRPDSLYLAQLGERTGR